MRLVFWMNLPSHHQASFFAAVHSLVPNMVVLYYESVPTSRLEMGWEADQGLAPYEGFVSPVLSSLESVTAWREAVHIVPGYGSVFLRKLVKKLSSEGVAWVHWSERSRPGFRWLLSYPIKFLHACKVNNSALGAFAIGDLAINDFLSWGIDRRKIVNLPYSMGLEADFSGAPDQEIQEFVSDRRAFLYVGSLYDGKGVDVLIKAFSVVAAHNDAWCLVLVGNEKEGDKYRRSVARLGLEDRVLFRGVVPASEIYSVYKAADVFVLPSRYDGWGMVLNEAAMAGLPLIGSTGAGGSLHLIQQGFNGFRVKPGSAFELSWAMNGYVKSFEMARLHGSRSKSQFLLNSSDVMAHRLVASIQTWQVWNT